MSRLRAVIALLLAVVCLASGCGFGDHDEVLILVRADDPASLAVGAYYAQSRSVPDQRILALELSGAVDAVEIDAARFESEIARPVEDYLAREDPDGEIALIVTTLGIPLRIGHCAERAAHYPRDCRAAAVDAALATLGRLDSGAVPFAARENPYFRDERSFARFRDSLPEAPLRFLVARLTGPRKPVEPESALPVALRTLIDRGGREHDGSALVWSLRTTLPRDQRPPATEALLAPIAPRLSRRGQPVCDGCPPREQPEQANGIVLQGAPEPPTGDDAISLEAPGLVIALSSAVPPSSPKSGAESGIDGFVGSWLARGASVLSGHIADPSLAGVTRPIVLLEAFGSGDTALEAHFKSLPRLDWMNVFVGDPLLALDAPPDFDTDDRDGDGIDDGEDNCLEAANPDQRDTDEDGFGNRCDPDVDNNGRVTTSWGQVYPLDSRGDLEAIALTARNGPHDPNHDLDGDGRVDERDLALAQLWLFRAPGPSGLQD